VDLINVRWDKELFRRDKAACKNNPDMLPRCNPFMAIQFTRGHVLMFDQEYATSILVSIVRSTVILTMVQSLDSAKYKTVQYNN